MAPPEALDVYAGRPAPPGAAGHGKPRRCTGTRAVQAARCVCSLDNDISGESQAVAVAKIWKDAVQYCAEVARLGARRRQGATASPGATQTGNREGSGRKDRQSAAVPNAQLGEGKCRDESANDNGARVCAPTAHDHWTRVDSMCRARPTRRAPPRPRT